MPRRRNIIASTATSARPWSAPACARRALPPGWGPSVSCGRPGGCRRRRRRRWRRSAWCGTCGRPCGRGSTAGRRPFSGKMGTCGWQSAPGRRTAWAAGSAPSEKTTGREATPILPGSGCAAWRPSGWCGTRRWIPRPSGRTGMKRRRPTSGSMDTCARSGGRCAPGCWPSAGRGGVNGAASPTNRYAVWRILAWRGSLGRSSGLPCTAGRRRITPSIGCSTSPRAMSPRTARAWGSGLPGSARPTAITGPGCGAGEGRPSRRSGSSGSTTLA